MDENIKETESQEIESQNINDEYELDEEELKKVEEMIKSSKGKRQKMIKESKPNPTNEKKSFIEICKNNILIPIILVIAIALIGFGIYFFWPSKTEINSLGFNYEQLNTNYHNSTAYTALFSQFKTELPELNFYDNESEKASDELKYFEAPISNEFTTYGVALQGSCRKSDGMLTGLRFMYEVPSTSEEQEANKTSLFLFYEMIMNSVFPDLTPEQIDSMLASTSSSQEYEVYMDIAYRFSIQKVDNVTFYALDFVPAADYSNVK